jgi:hypothetical protein
VNAKRTGIEYVLGSDFYSCGVRQARSLEFSHFRSHRGGEEVSGAFAGDDLQDLVNDGSKVHVQQAIRLVHDLNTVSLNLAE